MGVLPDADQLLGPRDTVNGRIGKSDDPSSCCAGCSSQAGADHTVKPMLIYYRTSLLESTAQTVVNTVNCVGVMGKGIAHAFKMRYPEMFVAYKKICHDKLLEPGKLWLRRASDQWVLNFPTKKHWRHPSKLEWIEAGLRKFNADRTRSVESLKPPSRALDVGMEDWTGVT
jgi:hypothetical protein